jgi:hypothetical protein
MKIRSDLFVVILSVVLMAIIFTGEYFFLKKIRAESPGNQSGK